MLKSSVRCCVPRKWLATLKTALDCGLTGHDWVLETGAKVHEVAELTYSKISKRPVRWVLAVPHDSDIRTVKDLQGKRIATEVVNLTKQFLRSMAWKPMSSSAGELPK